MRRHRRDPPPVTPVPRHVYVHVPFCARRCSYCDFAISVRRTVPVDAYVDGLARELEIRFPDLDTPWRVETLYLGGGTPSALGAAGVERLLAVLHDRLALGAGGEVTLEANPEDVTDAAVAAWRAAGVNRVSVGVQSFHAGALTWMHREHSAARAVKAVESVQAGGIRNVSADLIFGLPTALGRSWASDVRVAAVTRLGAPVAVWIDGRARHSTGPLGCPARDDGGPRGGVRGGIPRGARSVHGGGLRTL